MPGEVIVDSTGRDPAADAAAAAAHNKAMVDKVDGVPADPPPKEEAAAEPKARPENVPEKFWDPERGEVRLDALLKSNHELESKLGSPPPADPPKEGEDPPKDEAAQSASDFLSTSSTVNDALSAKGLDPQALGEEIRQNGKLSDASYADLEKAGFNKDLVDEVLAGQVARRDAYDSSLREYVGGADALDAMFAWAGETMEGEQIDEINAALASFNPARAKTALDGLRARYEREHGRDSTTKVEGGTAPTAGAYESWAQVKKDMATDDYKSDPAFRARVEAKLQRSNI